MKISDLHKQNTNRRIDLFNQPNNLIILVFILFSLIVGRLSWLQLFKGSYYKRLANENRIRLVSSPPIRGRILDVNGNILADNKLVYSLIVQPHLISYEEWVNSASLLSNKLDIEFWLLKLKNLFYSKGYT